MKKTTIDGYIIDKSVMIMNKSGVLERIDNENLKQGDYIAIKRRGLEFGDELNLNIDMKSFLLSRSKDSQSKIHKCNTPNVITEELALIIGYLIGDGGMTRNDYIVFTSKDEDMVENFYSFFNNVIGKNVSQKPSKIDYVVSGIYVREYFRQLGLKKVDAFEKTIPDCILKAPKNIVVKCLQGMFDTDGTVTGEYIQYCTASKKLSIQLQELLLKFGIVCVRRKKHNKRFNTDAYIIDITGKDRIIFAEQIGFGCKRKKSKLDDVVKKCKNRGFNTNKDIIPNQSLLVLSAINDLKIYNKGITNVFGHVIKGDNNLTYQKLSKMIQCNNFDRCQLKAHFEELYFENYYFSKYA